MGRLDRGPSEPGARPNLRFALASSVCAALCIAAGCGESEPPPNILLISIDSLRADHLSCYGYPRETSPRIDALAEEGVRFDEAASTTSWTLPAHASMFTGLLTSAHGCDADALLLPPERRTVAEQLKEAGYRTGGFWSGPFLHPLFGLSQGFDEYVNCASNPYYEEVQGKRKVIGEAHGDSHEDITSPKILEEVSKWLRNTGDEPFFLFVHMWDVHYDYIPPGPYDTLFDPDYTGEADGRNLIKLTKAPAERDLEHVIALYDGEIAWTDHHVGGILDVLEEIGRAEDTVVILTADHGEEFFEHDRFGHRKALYEESIAVPLVVRYPGHVTPGRAVDAPVSVLDIAPTILELAEAAPLPDVTGTSLVPLLRDGSVAPPAVVSELSIPRKDTNVRTIRGGDLKLFLDAATGEPLEVYDLAADPNETRDLLEQGLNDEALALLLETSARIQASQDKHRLEGAAKQDTLPSDLEESLRALGYIGDDE